MSAFSIPKQPRFRKFDSNRPGVGDYNIAAYKIQSRIKTTPSMIIGKSERKSQTLSPTPGPADYNIKKIDNQSPRPIILGKPKNFSTIIPGPGSYDLNKSNMHKKPPKYSFSTAKQKFEKDELPGPGDYDILCQKKTGNKISFSKQSKNKQNTKQIPGPGYYNTIQSIKQNQYSFGNQSKFKQWREYLNIKSKIPGPGAYDTLRLRRNIKGGSIFKNQKFLIDTTIPGPGDYNIDNTWNTTRSPRPIIGNSSRKTFEQFEGPGPADYLIPKLQKYKQIHSARIVFSKEKKQKRSLRSPGPGSYNIQSVRQQKGCIIKGRRSEEKYEDKPGPQDYYPNYRKFVKSDPKAIFGSQRKIKTERKSIPGPGQYKIDKQNRITGCVITKERKKSKQCDRTPGPGQYLLKPFFGNHNSNISDRVKQILYV